MRMKRSIVASLVLFVMAAAAAAFAHHALNAEFDAKKWAQFFIKYVVSHPAVSVARTGTTNAAHMLENIGGGIGRLPNEAMRKRMAEFVDSLPPAR